MEDAIKEFKALLDRYVAAADQSADIDPFDWSAAKAAADLRSLRAAFTRLFPSE